MLKATNAYWLVVCILAMLVALVGAFPLLSGQDDLKDLHSAAVNALHNGKSLDDQASASLTKKAYALGIKHSKQNKKKQKSLASGIMAEEEHRDVYGEHTRGETSGLTLRDIIEQTEAQAAKSGRRAHATIKAEPRQCVVSYKPYIARDSDFLDAGLTTASLSVTPRYYVFVCRCAGSVLSQRLDCFDDCETQFLCE